MLTLNACAKVNLTLEVLGKRSDGYHNVASIMQAIDLCDTLTLEMPGAAHTDTTQANSTVIPAPEPESRRGKPARVPGFPLKFTPYSDTGVGMTGGGPSLEPHSEISLECSVPSLNMPQNLVLRAAHLLAEQTGAGQGARIYLEKRIPEAGGLGGGSSDAAAALRGLNQLWGLDLPIEKLAQLAAALGSDVPFFCYGGTAMAKGRGDEITPLTLAFETWLVLLLPEIEVTPGKTAALYGRLTPELYTRGEATRRLKTRLEEGLPLQPAWLFNVFEKVAFDFFAGLSSYREQFLQSGARSVHLAGSGPTLFTLAADRHEAHEIWHRLRGMGLSAEMALTV